MNVSRTLSLAEVRQTLRVSRTTVWRLRKRRGPGGLRARKVGRRVRVSLSEMRRFLAEGPSHLTTGVAVPCQ
jgi:hypothetical protein